MTFRLLLRWLQCFLSDLLPGFLSRLLPALLLLCAATHAAASDTDAAGPQRQAPTCPPAASLPAFSPAESALALSRAPDRGLLWRIEKDGRSAWLYGTLHLGRAEWVFPGRQVLQALRESDTLALELDLADPATLAALSVPVDAAATSRLLTPERARRLRTQTAAACLPEGALARLNPLMQVTTLVMLAGRVDGLYADFGTELVLSATARALGQQVVALETAKAQLRALQGRSQAEQGAQIDAALDQLESGQARIQSDDLAQAWARSDWARLSDYPRWCDCMATPSDRLAMRRLLDDRNPGLADGIAQLHAQGRQVFAAVGALHMVGPQGLPVLLAARGFRVVQVVPAPP